MEKKEWKNLFHTYTYLNHCKRLKEREEGFTLVELLVVIAIMGFIGMILCSMFIVSIDSYYTSEDQIDSYSNARWAFMIIERQIKSSEEIFIKNDVIYMQDIETSKFYNYYTLENKRIVKNKVNKDTLRPITYGSKSQLADNINLLEISQITDKLFFLKIRSNIEGKEILLKSHIRIGVKITNK